MVSTATPTRLYAGAPDQQATVPGVRATSNNANAASVTSGTVTLPSSSVPGDVAFIYLQVQASSETFVQPAGWSPVTIISDGANAPSVAIFTKTVSFSDPIGGTISLSWSSTAAAYAVICVVYSSVDLYTPITIGLPSLAVSSNVPFSSIASTFPIYGLAGLAVFQTNDAMTFGTSHTASGWTATAFYSTGNSNPGQMTILTQSSATSTSIGSVSVTDAAGTNANRRIVPFMVGGPPVATPPTTRFTSSGTTTINEIEAINDGLWPQTYRVVDGGRVLVPNLTVPAKSVQQYQLREIMANTETLLVSCNGPNSMVRVNGIVLT